jgi:hypothetical protein
MAQNFIQAKKARLSGGGVTATATSIGLTAFITPDGTKITGSELATVNYGTLEPGTDKEEIISFTGVTQNVDGTATLTGVTRGLKFSTPYTADSALRYSHAGNTIFVLSNNPQVYETLVDRLNPTADDSYTPTSGQNLTTYDFVTTREGYWTGAVATFSALPIGAIEGEARVTLDTGKIYVWDLAESTTATIASVDTGTNVITFTGNHGLETGDYCYFVAGSSDLPAGLLEDTGYYIYKDSATEIHVSLTKAGATVDITDSGSGTNTIVEAEWVLAGAGGGAGTVYVTNLLGTDSDDAPANTQFSLTGGGSWTETRYLQVYKNGVLQELGATADYLASDDSDQITFNTAVEDTDKITLLVVSVDLYNPDWNTVTSDILPDTTNTYDIGSDTNRFKDAYLEGNVDIDGTLNVQGIGTFQAIPVIPTTDPTTAGQVIALDENAKLPPVNGSNLTNMPEQGGHLYTVVASDNLHISADTERTTTSGTYVIKKSILITKQGTYRVKFDLKDSWSATYGRIYKNGVAFGTEQSTSSTSYVTKSEDLVFAIGDYMDLYLKGDGSHTSYLRNFRLYYDETLYTENTVITD